MSRDQLIGVLLVTASIIVVIVYGYLILSPRYWEIVVKATLILAVVVVCGIIGWIGYTLATTPPPKPIEEIEKEIEEELKKLEAETKEKQSQ
ncbi:MAG: transcriptional regulator [Desulfurococcaceae archaeon]|nr:transcriptional regulator [Desulfurococcaceae archaeon]